MAEEERKREGGIPAAVLVLEPPQLNPLKHPSQKKEALVTLFSPSLTRLCSRQLDTRWGGGTSTQLHSCKTGKGPHRAGRDLQGWGRAGDPHFTFPQVAPVKKSLSKIRAELLHLLPNVPLTLATLRTIRVQSSKAAMDVWNHECRGHLSRPREELKNIAKQNQMGARLKDGPESPNLQKLP
jgi:hypothetical protein